MPLAVTRYYVRRGWLAGRVMWLAYTYHPRKGEKAPPPLRRPFAGCTSLPKLMDKLARRIARQHQRKTAQ